MKIFLPIAATIPYFFFAISEDAIKYLFAFHDYMRYPVVERYIS